MIVVVGSGGGVWWWWWWAEERCSQVSQKTRTRETNNPLFYLRFRRWQSPIGHHRAHQSIYLLLLTSQAFAVSPMSSTKAEEQKSSSNPSALQLEEKSRRNPKK